jgi:hypothetical protein
MATDDDRLQEVLRRLNELPLPDIQSADELLRHEKVRFASRFGLRQPSFRPVVKLRFHGKNVRGNALDASIGGRVVESFVETLTAVATNLRIAPGNARLFLAPAVLPGSTVLELVGEPRQEPDYSSPLVESIEDTPTDRALDSLFSTLEAAQGDFNGEIAPTVGKPMFRLTERLLAGGVDLDLTWTRPRGRSRIVMLPRSRARQLHDILDREQVERTESTVRGQLVAVSMRKQGSITVEVGKESITISGTADYEAQLRELWAHDVIVTWKEVTQHHPQRNKSRTERTFVSIEPAPPLPETLAES